MKLLNFAHPLTAEQLSAIERMLDQPIESVIDVKTVLDHAHSFTEQIQILVESIGMTAQEWQTMPLIINLPSLSVIVAGLLAELHGRMGYFPAILRLRPIAGSLPQRFEVAEIINLQNLRDTARARR
jgi:hypothetical protein